jgi:hypothetical protein
MSGRGTLTLPNGHVQSGDFRDGQIWRGAWVDENGGVLGGEKGRMWFIDLSIPLHCGALKLRYVYHNLAGWRSGSFYGGRDTCGRTLDLPDVAQYPARQLLEDGACRRRLRSYIFSFVNH